MTIFSRQQFTAEQLIREHVRQRIEERYVFESKVRAVIRRLLEAETGTDEASRSTGINVLADLLEKIIPVLEDDYKMLTTSKEQRESFRNHIVHAIKNSLNPIEVTDKGEDKIGENTVFNVNLKSLHEAISIDLDPQADGDEEKSIEGEFIDIEDAEEGDQFVQIDDQNETGRNFAAVTYKQVEKQIVDAYDMLADEEDKTLFYDYLLTNLLLYFDKFEDDLQSSLPDMTTDEYEDEKAAADAESPEPEETTDSPEAEDAGDIDDIFGDI